jgi:hypothetical protein
MGERQFYNSNQFSIDARFDGDLEKQERKNDESSFLDVRASSSDRRQRIVVIGFTPTIR